MYRFLVPTLLLPAALLVGSSAVSAPGDWRARQDAKDQADLAKALAGYTPGKPVSCIPSTSVRDTQRVGDTILYKVSSRRLYLTDTGGGCTGLRRGDAIVTRSSIAQFCTGDIVRTVDTSAHMETGACSFGKFVPYSR